MAKTAQNALIQYESSTTEYDEALTDSGDNQIFTGTADIWSRNGDLAPTIKPDGIVTGTGILTTHATNDTLNYSAFTAYVAGVLKSVTASTVTITRASTDTHVINSIQYNGTSVSSVKGAEGTSFSTTRGANGGPPYIAVGSIEIGQVKTDAQAAAAIASDEILQSANSGTQERYDVPTWEVPIKTMGDGNLADSTAETNAYMKFSTALATSHTGDTTKAVHAVTNDPTFTDIQESLDWVPAETSYSTSSTQIYRRTIGTATSTLGTGGFTLFMDNPATDALRKLRGKLLTFKFFHDYNTTDEYELVQGYVGFASSNPVDDNMSAAISISADQEVVTFGT